MSKITLHSDVIEQLNKFGESITYNRNSPYPTWRIVDVRRFYQEESFAKLRAFLFDYELTAYYRYYSQPKDNSVQTCVEIAPTVPNSTRILINKMLDVDGMESAESPCVYWTLQESKQNKSAFDEIFHAVKNLVADRRMISYKYRDFVHPPFYPSYNSIAIANSNNQFDIVYFEELYSPTHNIYESDVIKFLMYLEDHFGMQFIALDQIELKSALNNNEFLELKKQLSKLCPDIYYEGADMSELSQGKIRLYWDYDI